MMSTEKHKRQFVHYGLFVLGTAFVLAVAAVLTIWLPYEREHLAIAEIQKIDPHAVRMREGGPQWLRHWVGDRFMKVFDRVDKVFLGGQR